MVRRRLKSLNSDVPILTFKEINKWPNVRNIMIEMFQIKVKLILPCEFPFSFIHKLKISFFVCVSSNQTSFKLWTQND